MVSSWACRWRGEVTCRETGNGGCRTDTPAGSSLQNPADWTWGSGEDSSRRLQQKAVDNEQARCEGGYEPPTPDASGMNGRAGGPFAAGHTRSTCTFDLHGPHHADPVHAAVLRRPGALSPTLHRRPTNASYSSADGASVTTRRSSSSVATLWYRTSAWGCGSRCMRATTRSNSGKTIHALSRSPVAA